MKICYLYYAIFLANTITLSLGEDDEIGSKSGASDCRSKTVSVPADNSAAPGVYQVEIRIDSGYVLSYLKMVDKSSDKSGQTRSFGSIGQKKAFYIEFTPIRTGTLKYDLTACVKCEKENECEKSSINPFKHKDPKVHFIEPK